MSTRVLEARLKMRVRASVSVRVLMRVRVRVWVSMRYERVGGVEAWVEGEGEARVRVRARATGEDGEWGDGRRPVAVPRALPPVTPPPVSPLPIVPRRASKMPCAGVMHDGHLSARGTQAIRTCTWQRARGRGS